MVYKEPTSKQLMKSVVRTTISAKILIIPSTWVKGLLLDSYRQQVSGCNANKKFY